MRNDNTIQVRVTTELKERLKGINLSEVIRTFLESLKSEVPAIQQSSKKPPIIRGPDVAYPMNPQMAHFLKTGGKKGG